MDSKRRLPLLQPAADPDADPVRPRWQWVFLGALALFTVWLPLSAAAGAISAKLARAGNGEGQAQAAFIFAAASVVALGLAALAAGFLIGKWGRPRVGIREAALAGLSASGVALVASSVSLGFAPATLLVVPIAVSGSALGGWLGRRQ